MYIKKIELLNFQVIENFKADFNGAVYFVTGENELGKSTLLKAIGALLTGERDEVLRNGASKGFAKMIVGDDGEEFDVQLSFTEANPRGTLTIKQASTGMQTNNVSMLQKIFGYQDFDAVEFSRWSETAEGRRKQIAVIKSLLSEGVRSRIEAIDAEVAQLKSERTGVNRDVKTFAGLLSDIQGQMEAGDVEKYAKPIDVTALMERQSKMLQLVAKAKQVQDALAQRTQQLAEIPARIEAEKDKANAALKSCADKVEAARIVYENAMKEMKDAEVSVADLLKENIAAIEAEGKFFAERKEKCEKWLADYEKSKPTEDISQMIASAEMHNRKNAIVAQFIEKRDRFNTVKAKADSMDDRIATLTNERASLIAGAELPIEGLTFTEDGLELNGIPFVPGKISDSQLMEIAAKLIMASNPKVKVFRVARGESLGEARLKALVELAHKFGFQGFIEQVQRGQNEMIVEEYTES